MLKIRTIIEWSLLSALTALLLACSGSAPAPSPTTASQPKAAATSAPTRSSADMVAEGQTLFQRSCAACHGQDGTGVQGLGKDLVNSEFTQGLDDGEMLNFVKVGRGPSDPLNTTGIDMPPKGGNPALSDDDINAIIAYMRSIEQ